MLAESITSQLVAEIEKLYIALTKMNHSPADISMTINDILLHKGVTKDILCRAWDEWISKHEAKRREGGT